MSNVTLANETVTIVAYNGTRKTTAQHRYTGPLADLTFVAVQERGPVRAEVIARGRTYQVRSARLVSGLAGNPTEPLGIESVLAVPMPVTP